MYEAWLGHKASFLSLKREAWELAQAGRELPKLEPLEYESVRNLGLHPASSETGSTPAHDYHNLTIKWRAAILG
jgi:hypothetical protein